MLGGLKKFIFTPFLEARGRVLKKYLLPVLKDSKTLLDVGCGDMVLTKILKESLGNSRIVSIDVIDNRLINMPITIYDGEKIPFKNKTFDTAFAIFVLHHSDDEENLLKEMLRVAKKNVVIIEEVYINVFEKYYTYLHDWVANHLESFSVNVPFHFHNDQEWKKIFKKLDCKVEYEGKAGQFPLLLSLFLLTFTRIKIYILAKNN